MPIALLDEGDLVWSLHEGEMAVVPITRMNRTPVQNHPGLSTSPLAPRLRGVLPYQVAWKTYSINSSTGMDNACAIR